MFLSLFEPSLARSSPFALAVAQAGWTGKMACQKLGLDKTPEPGKDQEKEREGFNNFRLTMMRLE